MVVSIVLERNPELEFQDKVDLDRLVKEAFHEFQKDESRLKEIEKQVSQEGRRGKRKMMEEVRRETAKIIGRLSGSMEAMH